MTRLKLQVRDLTKVFAETCTAALTVLEDISFQANQGEFVCIVGPSGCGKTTLLKVIAGLENASNGSICVDGEMMNEPSPKKGMVFQEFALFPWRTVERNVEFGLEHTGVVREKRKEIIDRYLKMVNLAAWGNRYPFELSGGMKQRAAIARALANNPEILLMDEPFGSLDAQTRSILQDELLRIWKQTGKTIVFVSHNIEEATYLGDKIVVLTALPGRVKNIHSIGLSRPRNRASVDFIKMRELILKEVVNEVSNSKDEFS